MFGNALGKFYFNPIPQAFDLNYLNQCFKILGRSIMLLLIQHGYEVRYLYN